MLDKIFNLIQSIKNTSKTQEKINLLKKYANDFDILNFFEYCYSPYKNYQITSKDLKKYSDLSSFEIYKNIFELCDLILSKKIYRKTSNFSN